MYCRIWKLSFQGFQQSEQDLSLLGRTGVMGSSRCVEATDVADTDGVGVVTLAVGTWLGERASLVDAAVQIDDVVVADASEATGTVPLVDVGDGEGLAFLRRTAVDDDFVNCPHCSFELRSSYFER